MTNSNPDSKSLAAFGVALILFLLVSGTFLVGSGMRIASSVSVGIHVSAPIDLASTYQSPSAALPLFENAHDWLVTQGLDHGNTCVLFRNANPQCDLSNFDSKLRQDIALLNSVENQPIGSTETSNAMMAIHRSLYRHDSEHGEVLRLPALGFAKTWGRHVLLGTLVEWSALIAIILLVVVFCTV